VLLKESSYLVGCTKYPEYPMDVIRTNEYWLCIEGKVYGKPQAILKEEILDLLKHVFRPHPDLDKKFVADWLLETDGDFIIYAFNKKTNDFAIINDIMGRLPFYYYKNKELVVASREIPFVSSLIHPYQERDNVFDRMGIAQMLLFSHTLGKRTLLNNVFRLEPATVIRLNGTGALFQIDTVHRFNFEAKSHSNLSVEKNAGELVSLFSQACRNRADSNAKNIVTLSGGLDSRAVAACLHKNKIPGHAVTSTEPHWKPVEGNISEAEIAQEIAGSLNMEWENYGIMKAGPKDLVTMLKIKMGLTYLAHSFFLVFLEKLKKKCGDIPINFFTGHNGGVVFSNLSIIVSELNDLEDLARGIMRVVGYFALKDVSSLVQIKENEILDEILGLLNSYPEKDMRQKLLHYLFFEYNAKFTYEIEDLSRIYFWTVSPFNSLPFFRYIISCPDNQKAKYALYREFFSILSPSVAKIKNSNWGCSIFSQKFRMMQSIMPFYWKFPFLRKTIKRIKDERSYSYDSNSRVIRCIQDQVKNCSSLSDYLSHNELEKIIGNSGDYSHYGIDNLLTVTSLIENTFCDSNSIENHFID
jgi:asparagine synthase (glutamine-hydrolysing)